MLLIALLAVSIHTDFEAGNLGKVERVSETHFRCAVKGESDQDKRNRQANWYYFRVDGGAGRAITIDLVDLVGEYNYRPGSHSVTKGTRPFYSYDQKSWKVLENVEWDEKEIRLRLRLKPARDRVWIAHVPPYTTRDLARLLEAFRAHPHLKQEVIGKTVGGRDILLLTVTNPAAPEAGKKVIWLMARQHAWEAGTSWVCEGALRFLLSSDARAVRMRDEAVFKIIPMADPDGVARGGVRFNNYGYDLNRNWDTVDAGRMPEIAAQRKAVLDWVDAGRRVDLFLALHNTENVDYLEGPLSGVDSEFRRLAERFFRLLVETTTFNPQGPLRASGPTTTAGKPGRMTVNQGLYHERKIPALLMEQMVEYNSRLKRVPTIEDRTEFGAGLVRAMWEAVATPELHFPDRLHQFVWRNWELANADRMAQVAGCRREDILAVGRSMGLPPKPELSGDQLRRIYVTVVRQNWHSLPVEQLIELLGWSREKLEFTLKEDDFLDVKLGPKPECPRVRYSPPGRAAIERAAEIRSTLRRHLGPELEAPGEPAFEFIRRLSATQTGMSVPGVLRGEGGKAVFDPRYLYSYFALYGDPLLEPEIDPFPDGYLEKLAGVGINGVWIQCVLSTMAPSKVFPEFGKRSEERLASMSKLVARATQYGLKVYLYINEPRAMPAEFYKNRPEMKGAESRGLYAMCTSVPAVREWISESLAHIFTRVPELGGVFSISMSENLTNCFSKFRPESCPRCSQRQDWEVVGEVLEAIHAGVRRASRDAEVIVWDWGWPDQMARNLIPRLPRDARFLSVSEWSTPVERGGVKTRVGEYSISVVGPGPRATANWALAQKAGLRTMAKTQFNNTWEISAVPYIPVANLIARHCTNLVQAGVSGIMASWTLGGYPSPNLEIAREFYFAPGESAERILERVARRRYGSASAPLVLEAWKDFSQAFEEFPYGVAIYVIPTQHGPANLLRPQPTGIRSSMILFPQDDYKAWAGQYPPEVARLQFAKMAEGWERALPVFRKAVERVPAAGTQQAREDLAIAETCQIHFRSTANQLEFYLLRDGKRSPEALARMRALVADEIELARRLYPLARRHSVLAYEASNHYYYRPLDLAEKIVHCQYLLKELPDYTQRHQ